jgi:alpha-1,2-mannosyltransferase
MWYRFIHLRTRTLVEASTWPHFTLLGQSFGSIILGLEAVIKYPTEVYLDTMGYAFTYPIAYLLVASRVGCFVHYPTISEDMLNKVIEKRPDYNNNERIATSKTISTLKFYYYYIFSVVYGLVGRCSSCTIVNSTWTKNHIDGLWKTNAALVFPPCLASSLIVEGMVGHEENATEQEQATRDPQLIISISQFRPEKAHKLQLQAIKALLEKAPDITIKLVMIGSCRNKEDLTRVQELREYASKSLGLLENKDFAFKIDATREEVDEFFHKASMGIHTMWNEHFGIGIVEMMANGIIVIAHNSGGPKYDIVNDGVSGFLCTTGDEYASVMYKVIKNMSPQERNRMRHEASSSATRFTDEEFKRNFLVAVEDILPFNEY